MMLLLLASINGMINCSTAGDEFLTVQVALLKRFSPLPVAMEIPRSAFLSSSCPMISESSSLVSTLLVQSNYCPILSIYCICQAYMICFADRLVTALSGRVDLGARRVWGKLGNLLGLLSPAPSDVSEFCARGSRRLHAACYSLVATGRERRV